MTDPNLPEGSDNKESPFNQPDIGPTDEHKEQAEAEMSGLLEWGTDAEISFDDLNEQIQTVAPREYFTANFCNTLDTMEIQYQDKGAHAMLICMPKKDRTELKAFAEEWIIHRAQELAEDDQDPNDWLPW